MINRPMRLLLITDPYPPFIGGTDRQVQMTARAIHDAGHEVTVATPWQTGLLQLEDDADVTVHRVRALTTHVPWLAPKLEALYCELLSRRGPTGAKEDADGSHGSS